MGARFEDHEESRSGTDDWRALQRVSPLLSVLLSRRESLLANLSEVKWGIDRGLSVSCSSCTPVCGGEPRENAGAATSSLPSFFDRGVRSFTRRVRDGSGRLSTVSILSYKNLAVTYLCARNEIEADRWSGLYDMAKTSEGADQIRGKVPSRVQVKRSLPYGSSSLPTDFGIIPAGCAGATDETCRRPEDCTDIHPSHKQLRICLLWSYGPKDVNSIRYSLSLLEYQIEICPRTDAAMIPPQFLPDALCDSIRSGTFIDTKFYAFTRRDAVGCVCAPRALYCNSRILETVPYFSSCTWLSSRKRSN